MAPDVQDPPPLPPPPDVLEVPPSDGDQASLVPVAKPTSIGGTHRFANWIRSLSMQQIADMSASFATWKAAEMEWIKSLGKKQPLLFEKKRGQMAVKLATRLAKGKEYSQWLEGIGSKSRAPLRDFLKQTRLEFPSFVPKKDKVHLAACLKAWRRHCSDNQGLGGCLPQGNRRATMARSRVPEYALLRARGRQGPGYKSPELRELLWDWFVDIRRSLATILTPKIVLFKAKGICEQILAAQRATGHYTPLPEINRMWLLRWKRDKGVVLRRPNARYKCGKEVLERRLCAMWLNLIKVRHLASRLIGSDLSDRIYGIDEKPIHMNEAGSKGVGTLEVAGAASVRLKENHAQTRERLSLMTAVTSNPAAAATAAFMPFEMLCKGKTNRAIRKLNIPGGMRVSLQSSEKGSYRGEHIEAYLTRWLDPWTQLRAERQDWRILLLDVAKSHLGPEVLALCHARGYCLLYHYGCTTGVAQVNDTDLHGEFSRIYIDLETVAFNDMQLYDRGCFSRTLQQVLDDCCAAWRACDHLKGVKGHKSNGLSNALDGSEDFEITTSRDAGKIWNALNMSERRRIAILEVDVLVGSGAINSFEQWQKVVVHPADPGVRGFEGDGSEFEGEDDPAEAAECAWVSDEERAQILRDDAEVLACDLRERAPPPEVAEPLRLQVSAAQRLARLHEIRARTVGVRMPAAVGLLDAEIRQVERGLHAGGSAERQDASGAIRALMAGVVEKEQRLVLKRQKASHRMRKIATKLKAKRRKARAKAKATKLAKAEHKRKLDCLQVSITADQCSQKDAKGVKARESCLERLKLRAPNLSFEHDVAWPEVKKAWCVAGTYRKIKCLKNGAPVGLEFIADVNGVLKKLGSWYDGPTEYNHHGWPKGGEPTGDPHAFLNFFLEMKRATAKPRCATQALM